MLYSTSRRELRTRLRANGQWSNSWFFFYHYCYYYYFGIGPAIWHKTVFKSPIHDHFFFFLTLRDKRSVDAYMFSAPTNTHCILYGILFQNGNRTSQALQTRVNFATVTRALLHVSARRETHGATRRVAVFLHNIF